MRKLMHNLFKNDYSFSVISKAIGVITGVLYMLLFARYFGAELVGDSAVILNYVALISVIFDFGVYQAYPRFKITEDHSPQRFLGNAKTMFYVYMALGLLLISSLQISNNLKIALVILPMTIFIRQLNYVVLIEHPRRRNLASILLNIIDIVIICFLFIFTKANYTILVSFLIAKEIIYLIIAVINLKMNYFKIKPIFSDLKKYVSYGFLPMITIVFMTINYRIDIFMLNGQVTKELIGIYSLGLSLAERVWLIPDALKDILTSRLAKGKKEDEVAKVIRVSLFFSLIGIALIIIFGQFAINLLFGKQFERAYDITVIILFGVVGMVFYKMVHSYNVINGYRAINLIFLGISASLNIIGNLVAIPRYGIYGAAVVSSICYLICGFLFLGYFKLKSGLSFYDLLIMKRTDISTFIKR